MCSANLTFPKTDIWQQIDKASLLIRKHTQKYTRRPKDFLVGGAVRDLLLHGNPTDFDVEVFGLSYNHIGLIIKKVFGKARISSQAEFGSWHIRQPGATISYCLPRAETKIRSGHRGFTFLFNPSLNKKAACSRRDFTINALMADIQTGTVFDFYGGVQDLLDRTLRAVNVHVLAQDPLRVWRAAGLVSRLSLQLDPLTEITLIRMGHQAETRKLSGSKVKDELVKLLTSPNPSKGLKKALRWGLVESNLPELRAATHEQVAWDNFLRTLDEKPSVFTRWQLILKTIAGQSQQSFIHRLQLSQKFLANS